MKKLYSIALAVAVSLSASAQVLTSAQKARISDAPAEKIALKSSIKKSAIAKAPAKAEAEEGTWVKSSTGIWFEGPLASRFTDVDEGKWDVDIYENSAKPGYIRLNPYYEGTQPATLLGKANESFLEINISNPEKCYFEDWTVFNAFIYCSYCAETGFNGAARYGTLKDGILTFASGSIVYYDQSWYLLNGEIKIVLDKSTYVDYSVTAEAPFCTTANEQYLLLTKSDAIATVKATALNGLYPMNDGNANVVKSYGVDVTQYVGQKASFNLTAAHGAYSYLYVGLDAAGEIKDQGVVYSYILPEETEGWIDLGETTYKEGLLSSIFSDIATEDLKCHIEQKESTPGYFRLVNPYANHSGGFSSNHNHNHYIYINATDPDHVYVEASTVGAYIPGFGDLAAESWGNQYLDDITGGEEDGIWGKYSDGKITVPQFRAQLSDDNNGEIINLYNPQSPSVFEVAVPNSAGIADVEIAAPETKAVYYNLQGIRIAEPANGIFIKVEGNKAVKVIK